MHKKKTQTRSGPRKSKFQGGTTTVNPMKGPWPTRTITHCTYADQFDITLVADVLNTYTFNANGLFDPDQTGAGHQPLGFDQLAAQYAKYRVLSVAYHVTFGYTTANGTTVLCNVAMVNGSTVPSRYPMSEATHCKQAVCGSFHPVVISGTFDLTKLNTDREKYRIDDRYAAAITANPAEVMYLHVSAFSNLASVQRIMVRLVYKAEFYDIETPGSSEQFFLAQQVFKDFTEDHFLKKKAALKRKALKVE